MKKFFIFILVLFLFNCSSIQKSFIIHEKVYGENQKEKVKKDIYNSFWILEIDSVPTDEWLHFQGTYEEGFFIEKIFIKKELKTKMFIIYRTNYESDSIYYEFIIRLRTNDKYLWP